MKILITEDEPIIAGELESIVTDLGHQVVGIARSSRRAFSLAEITGCDLAFVDVHLSDGITGPTVARHLSEDAHATVIFTTANPHQIPEDFSSACGILLKPYSEHSVKSTIAFVVDCMERGSSLRRKPRALQLSPAYAVRWKVS